MPMLDCSSTGMPQTLVIVAPAAQRIMRHGVRTPPGAKTQPTTGCTSISSRTGAPSTRLTVFDVTSTACPACGHITVLVVVSSGTISDPELHRVVDEADASHRDLD